MECKECIRHIFTNTTGKESNCDQMELIPIQIYLEYKAAVLVSTTDKSIIEDNEIYFHGKIKMIDGDEHIETFLKYNGSNVNTRHVMYSAWADESAELDLLFNYLKPSNDAKILFTGHKIIPFS